MPNDLTDGTERLLTDEIAERIDTLRRVMKEKETALYPPVLALGISERVGSNWFLDTLGDSMHVHNEPFRQQLHRSHRLSSLNANPAQLGDIRFKNTHPYEWHWLIAFVLSKYSKQTQITKETNLFFAVDTYIALFPDAPIIVLSRHPVGIISSFIKGNLFTKWRYEDRYNQLKKMTEKTEFARYAFVFTTTDNTPTERQKVTQLIVLNALLLASSLQNRTYVTVSYEQAMTDQSAILDMVSPLVSESAALKDIILNIEKKSIVGASLDATFSTKQSKKTLETLLDKHEASRTCQEVDLLLEEAERLLDAGVVKRAREFLDTRQDIYTPIGRPALLTKTDRHPRIDSPEELGVQYLPDAQTRLQWRNTLVTNREYAAFLNHMSKLGAPNIIHGTQFLLNENMSHARGGRIHYDAHTAQYTISPGYENHPVYWVTWIGATLFARYTGARLPMRHEIDALYANSTVDLAAINADYRVGDVIAVNEGTSQDTINQLVGNVATWCEDGPESTIGESLVRHMYGTAWNTPATKTEIQRIKTRPITGCSRGVGIRLVKDETTTQASVESIVNDSFEALASLAQRDATLAEIDTVFIRLLLSEV